MFFIFLATLELVAYDVARGHGLSYNGTAGTGNSSEKKNSNKASQAFIQIWKASRIKVDPVRLSISPNKLLGPGLFNFGIGPHALLFMETL